MSLKLKPQADGIVTLQNGDTGKDLLTFDADGNVTANNGLGYVGGATLVDNASATFTNVDNNISATGIGVGVEVGDVIQVSGSTNNDTEFTVEVITDANNVIVNQAHAGGTTSKALVDETATVTVKLICKWYLAPIGLGQGWQDVTASRNVGVTYTNNTGKPIFVMVRQGQNAAAGLKLDIDGVEVSEQYINYTGFNRLTVFGVVPAGSTYEASWVNSVGTLSYWAELR